MLENLPTPRSGNLISGPGHAKMWLMPYAYKKGADQPARPRRLISPHRLICAFVVRCLESIICIYVISKVSRF